LFTTAFGPLVAGLLQEHVTNPNVRWLLVLPLSALMLLIPAVVIIKIEMSVLGQRDYTFQTGVSGYISPTGQFNGSATYSTASASQAWLELILFYAFYGFAFPEVGYFTTWMSFPFDIPFAGGWPVEAFFGQILPEYSPWHDPIALENFAGGRF
jgi:hypothetical protein